MDWQTLLWLAVVTVVVCSPFVAIIVAITTDPYDDEPNGASTCPDEVEVR
jgi:hypothetical protein